MKVGSVLLVLLMALVGLGYFMSDSQHLRSDLRGLRQQVDQLSMALQQKDAERQMAVTRLQEADAKFQSCSQDAERLKQYINQMNNEVSSLKEQNQQLIRQIQQLQLQLTNQTQIQGAKPTTLNWLAILTIGVGSAVLLARGVTSKHLSPKTDKIKSGSYVYLTDQEIRELIQRRRNSEKSKQPPHGLA
jgi:predicted RNase H-like nuclease (RuvC/YqgF family)